ncbi:MAG: hybrid sensor histidine kinase/response regulator [Pseudomonadota bacterium]
MTERTDIIIVDDDPIMRELACANLSEAGYIVRAAENGQAGLEAVKKYRPDLVISDLDMPVMSGYALTEQIRSHPELSQTPVIVITGSDHAAAVEQAFASGATSFVAKPINWALLSHSVKFVLRASSDQKALQVAKEQAEAGARFKDSLMSVMSHELRTPLNAIIGFGQLLGDQFEQEADHVHREYADYIIDGGKRLLNSVSDMLLASDARSGPITINEVACTVDDLIDSAIGNVSKLAEASDTQITKLVKTDGVELNCDRSLMARAISKLIDNSIKFASRGTKVIVAATPTKTGDIAILVRDNGPGIEKRRLENITQPFAQSDMSLRRSKEGLGLGLPLIQAICSAHGANFKLDSKVGEGTSAYIVLPKSRLSSRIIQPERQVA